MGEAYTYTAEFPLVRNAKAFLLHVARPGWSIIPGTLKREGKVVTWQSDKRGEYLRDMLDTVGYFGSAPQGRKAKLNGITAPPTF